MFPGSCNCHLAREGVATRYNGRVPFRIRKFQKTDFDTLWRIDQACFDAEMAYSRPELALYMRRPGAFTLVAEGDGDAKANSVLGYIVERPAARPGTLLRLTWSRRRAAWASDRLC